MKKTIQLLFLSLLGLSCTESNNEKAKLAEIEKLQVQNDSLSQLLIQDKTTAKNEISTFLTFQDNNAEKAMNYYMELFDNSKLIKLEYRTKDGPGVEGKIMHAIFELNGQLFMCSDSPPIHDWDFSPAVSNYIDCKSESELERLFSKLSENGEVTMPLNNYGFSQKFGWVIDLFGVSWQLNLK